MPLNKKKPSRKSIIADELAGPDDDTHAKKIAEEIVTRENERLWAHHRDPRFDITQSEAIERAISTNVPGYGMSQSSASRTINKLDETMLTEPVFVLKMDRAGEGIVDLRDYNEFYPDDYLERLREIVAMHIVDQHALGQITDPEKRTPEWAQQVHPDLNPNLGRLTGQRHGYETVHEEQNEADATPVDFSYRI